MPEETATDPAVLYIVATPIGNLDDISARALRVLRQADALACEDTRRTRILLDRYEIPKPGILFANHERNEGRVVERILGLLRDGLSVAICSDAGYPGISDPGYPAISQAIEQGYQIEVIPGASAVPLALLSSGLPTSSYTFKGFPPKKSGRCSTFLEQDAALPHTLVFYESPFRIAKFLTIALQVLGDRKAAVCIELTKLHERVHRGHLKDLITEFTDKKVKGEVAIVIAGNHPKFSRDNEMDDNDENLTRKRKEK